MGVHQGCEGQPDSLENKKKTQQKEQSCPRTRGLTVKVRSMNQRATCPDRRHPRDAKVKNKATGAHKDVLGPYKRRGGSSPEYVLTSSVKNHFVFDRPESKLSL